ncbi:MAG: TonB-dependent receptor [Chitinophagaceae bacterium]|nr:MAG: TonB-dependent receptor [Chitinophagaceae bacterium]
MAAQRLFARFTTDFVKQDQPNLVMKQTTNLRRLLLAFLLLAGIPSIAQQGSITGTLQDSAARKALQYATAELFAAANPAQAIKSAYSNDKGRFTINGLDSGDYLLIVSHTGFLERQVEITLSKGEKRELDPLPLSPAPKEMAGVVIKSRKPLIESSDDKVTFNVANDPVAKTETAIDILRRTPFVSVDGDGNITVNGQSNFKVLLNGRETAMFAQNVKEALKGFPGALITKIEVITTPSAKYDAEGVGGIINIITAKKVVGYNGSLNTYYTSTGWSNANANFSAKYGKVGFTLYYGVNGANKVPGITRNTYTYQGANRRYDSRELFGKRYMTNFWNFGNAELNYEIDSLNTVSVYGNVSGGRNSNSFSQVITASKAGQPDEVSFYDVASRNEYPTKSVGADYIRKFSSNKEREFSLRFNGEFGNSNSFNDAVTDNIDPVPDRYVINNSKALNRQYTVQGDYVHPMGNNQKFEGGIKAILRRATSDFESLTRSTSSEEYKVNLSNTNNFAYNQEVYSAYGTYSFKIKKTTFRLGARYEHTDVNGNFTSGVTKVVGQSYNNLLPNIQVSSKLGAVNTTLSFSQRLQRPFIWNLNPFENNSDALNVSKGNPDLQPQLIHSLSLGGRMSKGGTFFGLTLTGTYSDNMIVQFTNVEQSTGKATTTSGNLGKEVGLNLSGNVSAKIGEKWNVSVNGNVRWAQVQNKLDASTKRSGFGGNANLNSSVNWSKRFYSYTYAGYFKNAVTFQTNYALNLWYGIGTGVKLWNDKLNLSVGIANFFEKDRDYITTTEDPAFQVRTVSTLPNRAFSLGLTWNFGKMTENVSKKKGVTNDDLVGGSSSR